MVRINLYAYRNELLDNTSPIVIALGLVAVLVKLWFEKNLARWPLLKKFAIVVGLNACNMRYCNLGDNGSLQVDPPTTELESFGKCLSNDVRCAAKRLKRGLRGRQARPLVSRTSCPSRKPGLFDTGEGQRSTWTMLC
jgi:hypothetical protein